MHCMLCTAIHNTFLAIPCPTPRSPGKCKRNLECPAQTKPLLAHGNWHMVMSPKQENRLTLVTSTYSMHFYLQRERKRISLSTIPATRETGFTSAPQLYFSTGRSRPSNHIRHIRSLRYRRIVPFSWLAGGYESGQPITWWLKKKSWEVRVAVHTRWVSRRMVASQVVDW